MEVAAFHPHPCDGMRLVSVALFLAFARRSRDALRASGRYPASCSAEPGLSSAFALAREGSDGLADFESSFYHRARIDEAPLHDFARTQRNHALVAEAVLLGNAPRFAAER